MRRKKRTKKDNKLQLDYSGKVTVNVVRNGEVLKTIDGHNSGTYRLFEFIAKCLSGKYESQCTPKFLQIFHVADASQDISENLQSLVGIISVATTIYNSSKQNSSASASLTFSIPGELFNNVSLLPNLFALYSQEDRLNQTSPLATYYLDGGLTNIASDTNVIVVWELIIGNKQ